MFKSLPLYLKGLINFSLECANVVHSVWQPMKPEIKSKTVPKIEHQAVP